MTTEIRKARDKAAKALQGDVSRVKALESEITDLTTELEGAKTAVQKGTTLLSKLDEVLSLEGAPAKRGPGRPPKAAVQAGIKLNKDGTPRKKPGRKPKAEAKRGPGRPPKAKAAVKLNKDGTPRKKPGRKPKEAKVEVKAKRGPGRPPKAKAATAAGVKLNKDGTPRKKPGRKPKAEAAPAKAPKASADGVKLNKDGSVRKKPGRKPKDAATTESPAVEAKAEAAPKKQRAGRKSGTPSLKDSLKTMLASGEAMNLDGILEALEAKGLTPDSDDPRTYVNYILSTTKDAFERAGRGVYRLKGSAPASESEPSESSEGESVEAEEATPATGNVLEQAEEATPATGNVLEQAEAMLSAL